MYSIIQLAGKYLVFYWSAFSRRGHGIHSPFVFEFVTHILNAKDRPPVFDRIEELRAALRKDDRMLTVEDFGAGSVVDNARERRVGDIAAHAAKPAKFGRLLHRIAAHYGCRNVLEIGTSLGISTAYMASAEPVIRVITLEGAESIADLAEANFARLGLGNTELIRGNFDRTLATALERQPSPALIFFDGNHRKEPTLRYFRQCLTTAGDDDIFVFDDIHWSREMEEAWEEIKKDPRVTCSIDLFLVGLIFFRRSFHTPQHFRIRY
jgi:predicted O-methyltransferase YrrM